MSAAPAKRARKQFAKRQEPVKLSKEQREEQRYLVKQIVELRIAGAPISMIAKKLSISEEQAATALRIGLEEMRNWSMHTVDEVRTLEIHRLDMMQTAIWKRAMEGDSDAQRTMLKIQDMRAKYQPGVQVPQNVELTGADGTPLMGSVDPQQLLGRLNALGQRERVKGQVEAALKES